MSEPYTWERFAALLVDAVAWLGKKCTRHGMSDIVADQEKEIGRLRALTESSQSARRIEELEARERYHLERITELETKLLRHRDEIQAYHASLMDARHSENRLTVHVAELYAQLAKLHADCKPREVANAQER